MKKTIKKILLISIFISLFFGIPGIRVQAQVTVTSQVFAEVVSAITATETSQLNFGRFSPETAGGEVIVDPQGGRSTYGTVILVAGIHNSASFYITGEPDATYSITLPTIPVVITNVNNSKTMHVTDWSSIPIAGKGSGVLHGGSQTVNIGAALQVGNLNDNPTGMYVGTYNISFDYN